MPPATIRLVARQPLMCEGRLVPSGAVFDAPILAAAVLLHHRQAIDAKRMPGTRAMSVEAPPEPLPDPEPRGCPTGERGEPGPPGMDEPTSPTDDDVDDQPRKRRRYRRRDLTPDPDVA